MINKENITQDRLKELLYYNPDNGLFTWKKLKTKNKVRVGDIAGYKTNLRGNYIDIRLDGKLYKAHRLAYLYMKGEFPDDVIDHIDGDGTNNIFQNLRDVKQRYNTRNTRIGENNKTGIIGIYIAKGKYVAQIKLNDRTKHLGTFNSLEEAAIVRKFYERKLGYHENHGRKN